MTLPIEHNPLIETKVIDTKEIAPGTRVVTINGKLLLGSAGCAELEALIPQLVAAGVRKLVFDLSGMTRIDSTGIGRFIDTYGRLKQAGGEMRLAGATGAVRETFRLTRLDTVFSFYPTLEEAVEAARK